MRGSHGVYLLKGKQHCDTRLLVDHKAAHCTSRELFKCVIDEQARGIFQGKVAVRRNAQKTDGKQSSHALLLSPSAEFDTKPELEIFADDVICGHGATVGDLDEDQLFYLRARGIPAAKAKAMLDRGLRRRGFRSRFSPYGSPCASQAMPPSGSKGLRSQHDRATAHRSADLRCRG